MILLLCEDHDAEAAWLAAKLSAAGREILSLTSSWLANATVRHTITAGGIAATRLTAEDRTVELGDARAGLNRLLAAPGLPTLRAEDAAYSEGERWALWASIAHSLPAGVLGRGGPNGLAGPSWPASRWRAAAHRARLRVSPVAPGPANVLVVRSEAIGPTHLRSLGGLYVQFAQDTGCDVLGIQVEPDGAVAGANPLPALQPFAQQGVALIERALG